MLLAENDIHISRTYFFFSHLVADVKIKLLLDYFIQLHVTSGFIYINVRMKDELNI